MFTTSQNRFDGDVGYVPFTFDKATARIVELSTTETLVTNTTPTTLESIQATSQPSPQHTPHLPEHSNTDDLPHQMDWDAMVMDWNAAISENNLLAEQATPRLAHDSLRRKAEA